MVLLQPQLYLLQIGANFANMIPLEEQNLFGYCTILLWVSCPSSMGVSFFHPSMEPENAGLEDDFPFQTVIFRFHFSFR